MGASKSNQETIRYFRLMQKCDSEKTPHFTEIVKEGDGYTSKGEYDEFSGRIVSGKVHNGKTKEGKEIESFRLIFEDKDGRYQLELSKGQVTYNILNALATDFDPTREVKIKVYKKSEEKNGTVYHNGRAFITLYPHTKEDSLSWKYQPSEIPQKEPLRDAKGNIFMKDGMKMFDDTEQVKFYRRIAEMEVFPKFNEQPNAGKNLSENQSAKDEFDRQIPGGTFTNDEAEDTVGASLVGVRKKNTDLEIDDLPY